VKAVKGHKGQLCLIHSNEARLYNMIDIDTFLPQPSLSERDLHIAEEMYKKNILQKTEKNGIIGYKTFSNSL
jgi:hypothetical protein